MPIKERYKSLVRHETQLVTEITEEIQFTDEAATLRKKFNLSGVRASFNKWRNLARVKFTEDIRVLEMDTKIWDQILNNEENSTIEVRAPRQILPHEPLGISIQNSVYFFTFECKIFIFILHWANLEYRFQNSDFS